MENTNRTRAVQALNQKISAEKIDTEVQYIIQDINEFSSMTTEEILDNPELKIYDILLTYDKINLAQVFRGFNLHPILALQEVKIQRYSKTTELTKKYGSIPPFLAQECPSYLAPACQPKGQKAAKTFGRRIVLNKLYKEHFAKCYKELYFTYLNSFHPVYSFDNERPPLEFLTEFLNSKSLDVFQQIPDYKKYIFPFLTTKIYLPYVNTAELQDDEEFADLRAKSFTLLTFLEEFFGHDHRLLTFEISDTGKIPVPLNFEDPNDDGEEEAGTAPVKSKSRAKPDNDDEEDF